MSQPAERYARISELFQVAAELPPQNRAAFLERECADDVSLRWEVQTLLETDAQSDAFIEQPITAIPPDLLTEEEFAGRHFGPYEVIREIGRGGLGAVYLAVRSDGEYRKEVALKLIRRGLDTDDILRRFRTERQILAQLDHPNIARLLDGGTSDDGQPYFVMEYVKGEPLLAYCDSQQLGTPQRLALFRKVCAAVTYAHQNLVIHRDLKPSNILVTAEGEPKLLDFGIAKLLSAEDEIMFTQTAPSQRAMTPDYASPEQIKGEKIATASDVYSLGVILYELLSGTRPYRVTTRTSEEISRAVLEQTPQRPSANQKSLSGDLDNIALMALRKEPERRYASVERFSEDIRRHLEGRPVLAHKDTLAYRATKFVRRNIVGVAAAVFVFLTLLGGIVATTWQARQATAQARVASVERDRAKRESAKAQSINTFLQNVLSFSDPSFLGSNTDKSREATVSEALEQASRRAETELADQPEVAAAVHFTVGWTYGALGKLDKAEPHLRSALDIRRRVLGAEDQDTAQSMVSLGELFILRGNNKEAEAMFGEAVSIYRKARAKEEIDAKWFALALNGLSRSSQATKGPTAVCEALIREAIAVSASLTGADRKTVAIFYGNLAVYLDDRGDFNGAIAYTRRAIEEYSRIPGNPRLEMDMQLNNLGVLLLTKGEVKEAEPHLLEAIAIIIKKAGENHYKTAFYLANLSACHSASGDYQRAREEASRAMEIQQRVLPEKHADFVRSWMALGNALNGLGELTLAENYLRRALERAREKMPPKSPYVARAAGSLGENLMLQKQFPEAEELFQFSHRELKANLGDSHPYTAKAAERLRNLEQARTK